LGEDLDIVSFTQNPEFGRHMGSVSFTQNPSG